MKTIKLNDKEADLLINILDNVFLNIGNSAQEDESSIQKTQVIESIKGQLERKSSISKNKGYVIDETIITKHLSSGHDIKTIRVDEIGLPKRISDDLISNKITTIKELGYALGSLNGMSGMRFGKKGYETIIEVLNNLGCQILGPIVINDNKVTDIRLKKLEEIMENGFDLPKLILGETKGLKGFEEYYNVLNESIYYSHYDFETDNDLFRVSDIEFIGMATCKDGKTIYWKHYEVNEFKKALLTEDVTGKIILCQNNRYFLCECTRNLTSDFMNYEEVEYDNIRGLLEHKILAHEELLKCSKLWKAFKIENPTLDQAKALAWIIETYTDELFQMIIKKYYVEAKSMTKCIEELNFGQKGSAKEVHKYINSEIQMLKYILRLNNEAVYIEKGYNEGRKYLASQYHDQVYKEKLAEYKIARSLHGFDDIPLDETNIKVKGKPLSAILKECGFACNTLNQLFDLIITGKLQENEKMTKERIHVISKGLRHFGVNATASYRIITPSGELILGEEDVDEHILR